MRTRAKKIQKILDELYPNPEFHLYHTDVYTLLIAVLLSAQCTDKRVNLVTPLLFAKADNPDDMMKLTISEIQEIIHTCGLAPTKSKAIWNLSKMLVEEYDGRVPDTFSELEKMPGVGHKTASVVMAFGFGKPAFPVDTHIHRCAKRWGLSSGKSVVQTEKDLKALFPEKSWSKLHLQIISYGREYCKATGHKSEKCPVCLNFKLRPI